MDYTLAIYRQDAMDALSVQLTVENLLKIGYPEYLRDNQYDFRFPIRGLLIDRHLGHVLKMDRFGGIHKGYHGYRRLSRHELKEWYWDTKVKPNSERFHWIDTLFGLSEVTAFVSILESLEARGETVDYAQLFQDIREAIDLAHALGDVHRRVLEDLPTYIDRDPELAATLHKLRSSGKKLFLLTNSPLGYTEGMMNYLIGNALPEYRTWRHYFNVVGVSARKPNWFNGDAPFLELKDNATASLAQRLERGRVYSGGNLKDFERLTGVKGSGVLYVGDHIYGDILRSKKDSVWRGAMIIQELDGELAAYEHCERAIQGKLALQEQREEAEDELRFAQKRHKELSRKNGESRSTDLQELSGVKTRIDSLRAKLSNMDLQTEALERTIDEAFHPYWGSLLKEHGELSSFGAQVARYGDVYMRRVSTLQHYSASQFFRSPHDFMPHEL
jgi:HAD superfamily 5'-nucleotidase-like hydrolase